MLREVIYSTTEKELNFFRVTIQQTKHAVA